MRAAAGLLYAWADAGRPDAAAGHRLRHRAGDGTFPDLSEPRSMTCGALRMPDFERTS